MTSFGDRPGIMELEYDDENSKTMDYTKVDERLDSNENQEKDTTLTEGGYNSENHSEVDLLCCAMRGRNPQNPSDRTKGSSTEQRLEINQSGKTNCLTTVQKDNLLISCLTSKRSEYGKQIRKQYEAGEVKVSRKEIQQLEPRTDGKTNTLTTVQKDNLLIQLGREKNKGGLFDSKTPTLTSYSWQNNNFLMEQKDANSRIKGITIKENGIRPHQGDDKKSGISELGTILFEEAKTGTLTTVHQPLFFEERREQRNIRDVHTKAKTLLATSYKGAQSNGMTLVAAPIQLNPSKESNNNQPYQQNRVYSEKGTSPACMANMSCGSYAIQKSCRIRRLTPTECARLQTIPEWYKWECSNTQQYKMLGNGWTVEVIKHIFSFLPERMKSAKRIAACALRHREVQSLEQRSDEKSNALITNKEKSLVLEECNFDVKIQEATQKGFVEIKPGECFDGSFPGSKTRRGRKMESKSNCLMANNNRFLRLENAQHDKPVKIRIRRLTPTECARLQTIPEWYKWECSNTQQYKMLGNGWTVEVIKHIFSFLPDNLKQQK